MSVLLQYLLYLLILVALALPLGAFMAKVMQGQKCFLSPVLAPCERLIYKVLNINTSEQMSAKSYILSVLAFSFIGLVVVFLVQIFQGVLPFNPQNLGSLSWDLAFNTAASFITNTNWQAYSGEAALSYLTQAFALGVQNFVSAATGIAVVFALFRGFTKARSSGLGSFWVDLTRTILYILLPLNIVLALCLSASGVVQNFLPAQNVPLLEPLAINSKGEILENATIDSASNSVTINGESVKDAQIITQQFVPMGPAASQVAIKQSGTNGGGFMGVNSAHPLENPNAFSNLLEMLSILLIPVALCFSFGWVIQNQKQGFAVFVAMFVCLVLCLGIIGVSEQLGTRQLAQNGAVNLALNSSSSTLNSNLNSTNSNAPLSSKPLNTPNSNADLNSTNLANSNSTTTQIPATQAGGNMEGKEARFGIAASATWAAFTTAASSGSVNSMHDSLTPLGGMVTMILMQLGEVVFGGVGSGLYGMLAFVILTVFIAGLMVGRTPEFLGKKIEPYEMKYAALICLATPIAIIVGSAIAALVPNTIDSLSNSGAHGFSELLYAFSSAGANNGSAFAGFNANTPFLNMSLALVMLFARFVPIIAILLIAQSLAGKKRLAVSAGTLSTSDGTFILILIFAVISVGALSFFPALALGPLAEFFSTK